MLLSRIDLEKISLGKTPHLPLPQPPLLLIDSVTSWNDHEIYYQYNFKDNPLVKDFVPLALLIELGQGNMILADHMGLYKPKTHYRALGGDIFIHEHHIPKNTNLYIKVDLKKTLNIAQSTLITFDVFITDENNKAILTVRDFKSIFVPSEAIHKKGSIYEKPNIPTTLLFQGDYQTIPSYTSFHELSYGNHFIYSKRFLKQDEWFFQAHFINDPCAPGNLIGQSVYDSVSYYYEHVEKKIIQFEFMKAIAKFNILPHNRVLEIFCFINNDHIRADIICDDILSFQILELKTS